MQLLLGAARGTVLSYERLKVERLADEDMHAGPKADGQHLTPGLALYPLHAIVVEGHHHRRLLARRNDPADARLEWAERPAVGVTLASREDVHPFTLLDLANDVVDKVVARAAAA